MIINSGVYRDGHRQGMPVSLETTAQALERDPEVFARVDLYEPDPDELAHVRELFGLPAQATDCTGT
jgi:hypothetical protein